MGSYAKSKFEGRALFNESLKKLLEKIEYERIADLSLSDEELKNFANEQATIILKNLYKIPLPNKEVK